MIERNRNQVVSKDDINRLEDKIKELESQIFTAKVKGEEKKLDKLEENLKITESRITTLNQTNDFDDYDVEDLIINESLLH